MGRCPAVCRWYRGLGHLDLDHRSWVDAAGTWWFSERASQPLQNPWKLANVPIPGGQAQLPLRQIADYPFELPTENARDCPMHSYVYLLLLHLSFFLPSFLSALFLATSVPFLFLAESNPNWPPQKDSMALLKPVSGRNCIPTAGRSGGSGSSPLPPPVLGSLILLAVADLYISVLAGFCLFLVSPVHFYSGLVFGGTISFLLEILNCSM